MLTANRGGRSPRYGEKLVPRKVGWPPQLLAKLEFEAAMLNLREGKAGEWTFGRVAVERLAKLYDVELPTPEPTNDR